MRKKKILSLLLTFAMMLCLMPMKISGTEEKPSATLSIVVTDDGGTTYHPGSTINYAVKLGPITDLNVLQLKLNIPEGLTFVTFDEDAEEALYSNVAKALNTRTNNVNFDGATKTLTVNNCGSKDDSGKFSSESDTTIMTFSCTVDENVSGEKTVGFIEQEGSNVRTKLARSATAGDTFNLTLNGATTNITVVPTGVSLDQDALNVTEGASNQTLTATIAPEGATGTLVWTSNNESVATVAQCEGEGNENKGLVTINGVGTATITVTIQGTEYSSSCTVTVAACSHANKTHHNAVSETCDTDGNVEYWTCNTCGACFTGPSEDNLQKTEWKNIEIAAHHTYGDTFERNDDKHWKECTVCHATTTPEDHTYSDTYTYNSVDDPGYHWKACECGAKKDRAEHELSWVSTDADNHWKACSCGYTTESAPHTFGENFTYNVNDPGYHWKECECGAKTDRAEHSLSYTYDDDYHWQICDNEHCDYSEKTTNPVAHTLVYDSDENGHWQKCDNEYCDYSTEETAKESHDTYKKIKQEDVVQSTCSTQGSYTEVVYCEKCGREISRTPNKVIEDYADHTPGGAVRENVHDATCTEAGSYDEVVYCTICDHEISRTQKTISALGHTPSDAVRVTTVEPTCTVPGSYNNVVYCSVCEAEISREAGGTIEALGHDYQTVVAQAGDADHLGITEERCSRCGEKKPDSEKYYVKEKTAPSKYPDGAAIGNVVVAEQNQASTQATLEDEKVELTLEDPIGTLGEGFTVEITDISKDLGADFDGNYNVANAYKANVILRDSNGEKISGQLGGKVRLLLEVPEELWDEDDLQVLRINPGEDTEYDETIEYRLYDSNGDFIKVVDKDYQPEAGQTVKKFLAVWTDHFSDYVIVDPVNGIYRDSEGNIVDSNGNIIRSALKTGQNIMEAYFIGTTFSLSIVAIYLALKKKKMFENK